MAQRKTKAQKLASLRAKERAAKRTKPITALDLWAIRIHESTESMKRAGWEDALITSYVLEQSLPDWVIAAPERPVEDDDDEEEEDY
jgi:hypothetical protein